MVRRRELWPGYSTYTIWQTLLGTTRKVGRDHAVLAELYSTHLPNRLTELVEDVQRIYKKVLSFTPLPQCRYSTPSAFRVPRRLLSTLPRVCTGVVRIGPLSVCMPDVVQYDQTWL